MKKDNNQNIQAGIPDDMLRDEFVRNRLRYEMTQREWADAIGISHPLVKRIESGTIRCSEKTIKKMENFMQGRNSSPNPHAFHTLEEYILSSILLTSMNHLRQDAATSYAHKCTYPLWNLISGIKLCPTDETQRNYIDFLQHLLDLASTFADDNIDAIQSGAYYFQKDKLLNSLQKYSLSQTGSTRKKKPASVEGQVTIADLQQ